MVCASGDAEAHRQLYVAAPRKVRRGWIKVHRTVAARSTQRTGAQRISYTLAAAAAACGLNKSTVLRAIKAGKVSGTKDEHGERHIEAPPSSPSRLPVRCGRGGGKRYAATGRNAGGTPAVAVSSARPAIGRAACPVGTSTWCLGFVFGGKVHVRPARSIFSNALNLCCSAIAALVRSP
jgi:hypothetical protein